MKSDTTKCGSQCAPLKARYVLESGENILLPVGSTLHPRIKLEKAVPDKETLGGTYD